MPQELRAIDAHVGGAPVRLLVGGVPRPSGTSLEKRRGWLERQADHVRRAALLEPRGHRDLVGVLLTEPFSHDADAGLLFLAEGGYPALSGTAVIAAATIALERGLITKAGQALDTSGAETVRLGFETPAGTLTAVAVVEKRGDRVRVTSVRVTGVPSFVAYAGLDVKVGTRRFRVDLAYGGAFYAIVDSESVGLPLAAEQLSGIRRLGADICAALEDHEALVHPEESGRQLGGTVFTGPPRSPDGHLRSVTITRDGGCDRSPGVTGTAAVMCVLDAMGLLQDGGEFVHEGLLGLPERGRIVGRARVGDLPAIVPEVAGTAWITGDLTLYVEDDDPLRDGYTL